MIETLEEAQGYVYALREKGVVCPCCGRFSKVYKRGITGSMARSLIALYWYFKQPDAEEWVHSHRYLTGLKLNSANDVALLRHWGLIEAKQEVTEDGNPRNGYHRITKAGRDWVEGKTTIPRRLVLYNQECVDFDGEPIGIERALGKRFDYQEVMHA